MQSAYFKKWTGLEWNIILRKAEKCEEWRKLVVKSTVVTLRSARLRVTYDKVRRLQRLTGSLVSTQLK